MGMYSVETQRYLVSKVQKNLIFGVMVDRTKDVTAEQGIICIRYVQEEYIRMYIRHLQSCITFQVRQVK